MPTLKIENNQIHRLKLELMDRYVILMISILGVYSVIFIFFIPDKILTWYLPAGILFLGSGYSFARKRYSPNLIVNTYLILAPVFSLYLMLALSHACFLGKFCSQLLMVIAHSFRSLYFFF